MVVVRGRTGRQVGGVLLALALTTLPTFRAVADPSTRRTADACLTLTGCEIWSAIFDDDEQRNDIASAVVVSPDGSRVFVAGVMRGKLGERTENYGVVAYDAVTGAQLWMEEYDNSANDDGASAIAVSPGGDRVYVTGESCWLHNGITCTAFGYATIAYDAVTGARLWVSPYDDTDTSVERPREDWYGRAIVVSPDGGRVYAHGTGGAVAYNAGTGAELWRNGEVLSQRHSGGILPRSLAMSGDGSRLFVTGSKTAAINSADGTLVWSILTTGFSLARSPDSTSVYVAQHEQDEPVNNAIALNAATGTQLWSVPFDPGAARSAFSIGVGMDGATVYVAGFMRPQPQANADYAITAYRTVAGDNMSAGSKRWEKTYDSGFGGSDIAEDLVVAPDGRTVYLSGRVNAVTQTPGDADTVAYDARTGAQLWARRLGGPRSESAHDLAMSATGTFLVGAGRFRDGSASDKFDFLTFRYNVDLPPIFAPIGDKAVKAGHLLQFATPATDGDGDAITYSASNLPPGATYNASTWTFSWTPSASQVGKSFPNVRFTASDGPRSDVVDITITVLPAATLTVRTVPGDYATIPAAVAAAGHGDTIIVAPGTYNEFVSIGKSVTLRGAQAGVDARTRSGTELTESIVSNGCGDFQILADDVVIDGFTIQGVSTSPNVDGACLGAGVHTSFNGGGNSGLVIKNNIIKNNIMGVYLNTTGVRATLVQRNAFIDNRFEGPAGRTAIYSDQGLRNVRIEDNRFTANPATLNLAGPSGSQSGLRFSGNRVVNGGGVSVANVTDVAIFQNTIAPTSGAGVRLRGGADGVVIARNTIAGPAQGIQVSASQGANANVTVRLNNLVGNGGPGLLVDSGGSSAQVNARRNWWGCAAGPGTAGCDAVSGDADVTRWCTLPDCEMVPGETRRVSVSSDGGQGPFDNIFPAMSSDGRFIAFKAVSPLVPDDTNGKADIYVHNRQTGETVRASVCATDCPSGPEANDDSGAPSISEDGRWVAFESDASNLVAGDTNGRQDIFLRDMRDGQTVRISVNSSGDQTANRVGEPNNPSSYEPSISADGRYVAFTSLASNLVPDDTNILQDVFVRDRIGNTTTRVSVATGNPGAQGTGRSEEASISADGLFVSFTSLASDLVPGDTNGKGDVFVRDRIGNTTRRASVATDGTQHESVFPTAKAPLSGDGRLVVFYAGATNLVPGPDSNGTAEDVFLRDLVAGTTVRVSLGSNGEQGNSSSHRPAISSDGRFVAFESLATNFANDTNGRRDVFVRDLLTGTTRMISVSSAGVQTDGDNELPSISSGASGPVVAFRSLSTNLVEDDTNGKPDIFAHLVAVPSAVSLLDCDAVANDLLGLQNLVNAAAADSVIRLRGVCDLSAAPAHGGDVFGVQAAAIAIRPGDPVDRLTIESDGAPGSAVLQGSETQTAFFIAPGNNNVTIRGLTFRNFARPIVAFDTLNTTIGALGGTPSAAANKIIGGPGMDTAILGLSLPQGLADPANTVEVRYGAAPGVLTSWSTVGRSLQNYKVLGNHITYTGPAGIPDGSTKDVVGIEIKTESRAASGIEIANNAVRFLVQDFPAFDINSISIFDHSNSPNHQITDVHVTGNSLGRLEELGDPEQVGGGRAALVLRGVTGFTITDNDIRARLSNTGPVAVPGGGIVVSDSADGTISANDIVVSTDPSTQDADLGAIGILSGIQRLFGLAAGLEPTENITVSGNTILTSGRGVLVNAARAVFANGNVVEAGDDRIVVLGAAMAGPGASNPSGARINAEPVFGSIICGNTLDGVVDRASGVRFRSGIGSSGNRFPGGHLYSGNARC